MTPQVDIEALAATLDALRDDDLVSVYSCQFADESPGDACGFDGESLDQSRDECHHTLPERIARFAVRWRKDAPALLAELAAKREECERLREARDDAYAKAMRDLASAVRKVLGPQETSALIDVLSAAISPRDDAAEASKVCTVCGCRWRVHTDGTHQLYDADQRPGQCCNNAANPPLETDRAALAPQPGGEVEGG